MVIGTKRTEFEINELIKQWTADPCWDLAQTEGFEAHFDRLFNYQRYMNLQFEAERKAKEELFNKRAESMSKADLLRMIESLQEQIDAMHQKLYPNG